MWQDIGDNFLRRSSYGRRALPGGGPSQRGPIGRFFSERPRLHRSWIYKLLARYEREGEAGLAARSRRPRTSPTAVSHELEERIVEIRKELFDAGHDYGSETIKVHLEREGLDTPSVSSIWRVLKRRGFITPQPQKRPKSSYQPV